MFYCRLAINDAVPSTTFSVIDVVLENIYRFVPTAINDAVSSTTLQTCCIAFFLALIVFSSNITEKMLLYNKERHCI